MKTIQIKQFFFEIFCRIFRTKIENFQKKTATKTKKIK